MKVTTIVFSSIYVSGYEQILDLKISKVSTCVGINARRVFRSS